LKPIIITGLLCLASCNAAPRDTDRAIADLENRVAALERASGKATSPESAKRFELLAPALGNERRFYATEAQCQEARTQILNAAANRVAEIEASSQTQRHVVVAPPFVSCVSA
jgi:hypothetical protein